LAFSFTLHSSFIGIIDHMSLKCSSLSFSIVSSLIFCTLICWILLLWLGVRPRLHQRGAGAVSGVVVLEGLFCPEVEESGWSNLGNRTVQFGGRHELVPASVLASAFASRTLFCSAVSSSGLFFALGFVLSSAEDLLLDLVLP
jgi:hypothetical protein